MPEKRTKYDREFREWAIRIVNETGRPISTMVQCDTTPGSSAIHVIWVPPGTSTSSLSGTRFMTSSEFASHVPER